MCTIWKSLQWIGKECDSATWVPTIARPLGSQSDISSFLFQISTTIIKRIPYHSSFSPPSATGASAPAACALRRFAASLRKIESPNSECMLTWVVNVHLKERMKKVPSHRCVTPYAIEAKEVPRRTTSALKWRERILIRKTYSVWHAPSSGSSWCDSWSDRRNPAMYVNILMSWSGDLIVTTKASQSLTWEFCMYRGLSR